MTMGDIAGIVTAIATALTVVFLAWDRFEKMRLPTPDVELARARESRDYERWSFTVRNRAEIGVRVWKIQVVSPVGAELLIADPDGTRTDKSVELLNFVVNPHGFGTSSLLARLPEPSKSSRRLKIEIHMAFESSKVSRRRITIRRQA